MAQHRLSARVFVKVVEVRAVRPIEVAWGREALLLSIGEATELALALTDSIVQLRDGATP